jgi:hypothetical protein
MPKCQYCPEEIAWLKTAANKWMPVEVQPGIVTIMDNQGKVHKGQLVHWGRCPGTEQAKKRKDPTAPTQEQVAFSCCGGIDAHRVNCPRR